MNSNYTTYTGTFRTRDGRMAEGSELVYDIEYNGFRVFNWNTVQGTVTEGIVNFSFDKTT